ncbi:MAG: hypothetical protein LQ349_003422 [Xanthoria aureola]|nr:MAG: hypothetical protein LQ349_003422 [Xanthoria aureola]
MACSLLPPEICLHIFEFCPSVPTAARLAQVSKPFNNTWMSYKKSVCLHILERTVECYQDARRLVTQDIDAPDMTHDVLQQSLERYTRTILANAKVIEDGYETIIHDLSAFGPLRECEYDFGDGAHPNPKVGGQVKFSPVERQRLFSAWYKIRQIIRMLQRQPDREFPACLSEFTSSEDVFRMLEFTRTICELTTRKDMRGKLGMDLSIFQLLHLPIEVLLFTPNPQESPWEAVMVWLRRYAFVRVKEEGLWYVPGEGWNLRVLLDAYRYVLTSRPPR